jgi:hypothetical protein
MASPDFGPLAGVVKNAGVLLSAAGAVALAWKRRARWEPAEEDVPQGAQRLGGLVGAIGIGTMWTTCNSAEHLPTLRTLSWALGLGALASFLVYGYLVGTMTYEKVVIVGNKTISRKIIGGFWLTELAMQTLQQRRSERRPLTIQQLFKGSPYDEDKVWSRQGRALAKQCFLMSYLGVTVCGTMALAAVSISMGVSK